MSPHVGNFVQDLVEMAKATEELPIVREQLLSTQRENSSLLDRIQNLEMALHRRSDQIDELHELLRKTEVERSNAEAMFLDANDRTDKALAFVRSIFGNAGTLIQALEPPKPEPVAQPVPPVPEAVAVQGTEPVSGMTETAPAPFASADTPQGNAPEAPSNVSGSEGQREPGPTAPATPAGETTSAIGSEALDYVPPQSQPEPVSVQSDPTPDAYIPASDTYRTVPRAASSDGAGSPAKPYHGKMYINVSGWISRQDWLAGGGTEETFDWREGQPLPEGWTRNGWGAPVLAA